MDISALIKMSPSDSEVLFIAFGVEHMSFLTGQSVENVGIGLDINTNFFKCKYEPESIILKNTNSLRKHC